MNARQPLAHFKKTNFQRIHIKKTAKHTVTWLKFSKFNDNIGSESISKLCRIFSDACDRMKRHDWTALCCTRVSDLRSMFDHLLLYMLLNSCRCTFFNLLDILQAASPQHLTVEHCAQEHFSGFYLRKLVLCSDEGSSATYTVIYDYNILSIPWGEQMFSYFTYFSTLKIKLQNDAPLTFPFSDECLPPCLHVQAQVFHHAVDTVVQGETARLRLDRLSTHGALIFLLAPLLDAVTAETMSTVQDDCLYQCRGKTTSYCTSGLMVVLYFCYCGQTGNRFVISPQWKAQSKWCTEARFPELLSLVSPPPLFGLSPPPGSDNNYMQR